MLSEVAQINLFLNTAMNLSNQAMDVEESMKKKQNKNLTFSLHPSIHLLKYTRIPQVTLVLSPLSHVSFLPFCTPAGLAWTSLVSTVMSPRGEQ